MEDSLLSVVVAVWESFCHLPQPASRTSIRRWRADAIALFQSPNLRNDSHDSPDLLSAQWLSVVLEVESRYLHPEENVRGFVEILRLWWSNLDKELVRFLNSLWFRVQRQMVSTSSSGSSGPPNLLNISFFQLGSHIPAQSHQHCVLEELTRSAVEDYLTQEDDELSEVVPSHSDGNSSIVGEEDRPVTGDMPSSSIPGDRNSNAVSSPPRKKARFDVRPSDTAEDDASAWQSFLEQVDETVGNASDWGTIFHRQPHIWTPMLRHCKDLLTAALPTHETSEPAECKEVPEDQWCSDVVYVVRRLRRVLPCTFRTPQWVAAVKSSGLAALCLKWSDPRALATWRAPHATKLLRFHRIDLVLLVLLLRWTPQATVLSWPSPTPDVMQYLPPKRSHYLKTQSLRTVGDFLKALRQTTDIIPFASLPSSPSIWHQDNGEVKPELFRLLIQSLQSKADSEKMDLTPGSSSRLKGFVDPRVEVVMRRSLQFHKLKNDLTQSFENHGGLLHVPNRSGAESATPHKPMSYPHILPGAERPRPHPKPPKACTTDLKNWNWKRFKCNEAIIQRCKIQVFRFVNDQGDLASGSCISSRSRTLNLLQLDFLAFQAFPDKYLQRMLGHFDQFSQLKSVVRGQQFDRYVQGTMVPQGERTPSGGAPGDCHRYYDNMNAEDVSSLDRLFDTAEDSLLLTEITRVVAFPVHEAVVKVCQTGERMGRDSLTMFYCNNYAAPVHIDDDAGTGLCAQLEVQVPDKEYSFFHYAYGKLFKSRTNCLWSFRGLHPHGTVLPPRSKPDAAGGDNPVYKLKAVHVAKPKKNAVSAERYNFARKNLQALRRHWEAS
ncbi:hypothetical protein NMY22_g17722 [Coprinellus aureogranulatus]|nr:hypothetical protein NMY22_g17722 [Coprinellus aureogranulatus]